MNLILAILSNKEDVISSQLLDFVNLCSLEINVSWHIDMLGTLLEVGVVEHLGHTLYSHKEQ